MRVSVAVANRLSSCDAWAQVIKGMWDPPQPEIEPMSPGLEVRFLTSGPLGKPLRGAFK